MATLLDFRRRIRSVKSSQQITRAMKFVAAARLRRAQEAAIAARPYAQELARLLRSIMSRIQDVQHPLMETREEKNVLAIILTGERGLAGAFNLPADQDQDEKSDPNQADLRVLDGFNPNEPLLEVLRQNGVTIDSNPALAIVQAFQTGAAAAQRAWCTRSGPICVQVLDAFKAGKP